MSVDAERRAKGQPCEPTHFTPVRHSRVGSIYIPTNRVPARPMTAPARGMAAPARRKTGVVQMQAQLLHAVSGEAERQEGAMELGHGARFTADKTARRARTAGTGFNFQRVPGPTKRTSDSRPFVVYQHGRYTPIGGEGGLVRGWTFHDDSTDGPDWWRPDRERATADVKGGNQPQSWFKEEPKRKKKPKRGGRRGTAAHGAGGWVPGTSLKPRRAANFLSNQGLDAVMLADLRRGEARLQQTRAGNMFADVMDEPNLPYQPPARPASARPAGSRPASAASSARPASAAAGGRGKEGNVFTKALQNKTKRRGASPQPEPEPEPEPGNPPSPHAETAQAEPSPEAAGGRPASVAFANSRTDSKAVEVLRDLDSPDTHTVKHAAASSRVLVPGDGADPDLALALGRCVWVGNIEHRDADEDLLRRVFEVCGRVEDIEVREKYDTTNVRRHDWAKVTFYEPEHAVFACEPAKCVSPSLAL